MIRSLLNRRSARPAGFTLVELLTVMMIVAVLVGVITPRYVDWSQRARESADAGAIAGIGTALQLVYSQHRLEEAPGASWVSTIDDIPAIMEDGRLPEGITRVDALTIEDQRGNLYDLQAETASTPARLQLQGGGGP
jgi:MSHA pilin protein MshA